jgi:hypothetical protein
MKEVLFKYEAKSYFNQEFQNYCDIDEINSVDEFTIQNNKVTSFTKKGSKKFEGPIFFTRKSYNNDESCFEKNYGNPLFGIFRQKLTIVVEKEGNKVCLKYFFNSSLRKVGKTFFQKSTKVVYLTSNLETGDVYRGHITNYHLKRKATKSVRKNQFTTHLVAVMKNTLKSLLDGFGNQHKSFEVSSDAIRVFMNNIVSFEMTNLSDDDKLYKFYLDRKNVKYPNNFPVYRNSEYGIIPIMKDLKKTKLKMVDAFLKKNNLSGKVLKKVLHECNGLNIKLYQIALKFFGSDWLNQDPTFLKNCLESQETTWFSTETSLSDVFSPEELKRVFNLFKKIIEEKSLQSSTFYDHIRFYIELKSFGEEDLRWNSSNNLEEFRQEHLDWTEKLSQYKTGNFFRIYPKKINEYISHVIKVNDVEYVPVLLTNSTEYNDESFTQSNCVKTYIQSCNTIIISLRKNNMSSSERATIEYRISKDKNNLKIIAKRVQDRVRFNQTPSPEWVEPMSILDERVNKYVRSNDYENVKLKKDCRNGKTFEYDSFWNENNLVWNNYNNQIFNTF